MQVTSLQELKQMAEQANGEIIEIPGFTNMGVLRVRVKQVSLLDLTQCDILPNSLLIAVNGIIVRQSKGHLFEGKQAEIAKQQMEEFADIVYKAALVEPSIKDFEDAGLKLTLIQKRIISEYAIGDMTTYNRFRQFREGVESDMAEQAIQQATERDNGNN